MVENLLNPVILFFAFGLLAGLIKTDLELPNGLYLTLTMFLLIAIGLKGGLQLSESSLTEILVPSAGTIILGIVTTLIAYFLLKFLGKFNNDNASAISAHYGSVSVATYAVVIEVLSILGIEYEGYVTVLLILLEMPAIMVGIGLSGLKNKLDSKKLKKLFKEVFLGKSIYLLVLGLFVGWICGVERSARITPFFFTLFDGILAFFLLEMGIICSQRLTDLKKVGPFLLIFALIMPLISAFLSILLGKWLGLSLGGTIVLTTMGASASYIAAPAAARLSIPDANPTYYLTASLGITFPFNVIIGIPLYIKAVQYYYGL